MEIHENSQNESRLNVLNLPFYYTLNHTHFTSSKSIEYIINILKKELDEECEEYIFNNNIFSFECIRKIFIQTYIQTQVKIDNETGEKSLYDIEKLYKIGGETFNIRIFRKNDKYIIEYQILSDKYLDKILYRLYHKLYDILSE